MKGIEEIRNYWDGRASSPVTDCEKVEASRRAQKMRFESFVLNHDLHGKSILDIGCGVGDFYEHLLRKGIDCEYTGIDLSEKMIARCRERFPGVNFECCNLLTWGQGRSFDYVIAIAIHNVRARDVWNILQETTRRQFELCTIAAHLSLLTDRYEGFAGHIKPWSAERILTFALSLTPYVTLRHDYLPNDFSVTLYREPMIDTHPGLLLE